MLINTNHIVDERRVLEFFKYFNYKSYEEIEITKGKENSIKRIENKVIITCIDKVYVFRMLSFLFKNNLSLDIHETPISNQLTYYTDCSRNGVLNLDFFKEQIYVLASVGYNRLGLYTEDTYEVLDEPYFGHLRGRYTIEEIKQMVAFAEDFGIELIPAIATLAHIENIFFWTEYEPIRDCNDIILIDDERTYKLFDNMFKSLALAYKSREIHIGFDEAHSVCLGKYYDVHGACDRVEVTFKHLKKVCEIAKKYGFNVSMWSDMFFRLEYQTYYPELDKPSFSEKVLKMLPEGVKLVYWDYYHVDQKIYDKMIERHLEFGSKPAFAGGSWNWLGYAPMNRHSFSRAVPAINSCKKYNIQEIYVTAWGDNGNECSRFAVLPTMFLYGEFFNNGHYDEEFISNRLKQVTGLSLNDFNVLDYLNDRPGNEGMKVGLSNPAKYLVYNDPLNGVFDFHISEVDVKSIKYAIDELQKVDYKNSICCHVYETLISLGKMLLLKTTLGNDIYHAYHEKDMKMIKYIYSKRIPNIRKALKEFYNVYRKQWFKENKEMGFEVIQGRLSYQFIRLEEASRILKEFHQGKATRIETLEQPKLSQKYAWEQNEYVYKHNYIQMPNVFMNK